MEIVDSIKLGKFITERRKALGLTQAQLGERIFISRKSISKWETGLVVPSLDMLPRLASFLDVSIDELLDGKIHEKKNHNISDTIKVIIHKMINAIPTKKEEKQRPSSINITINIGNKNIYTKNENLHIYYDDEKK